MSEIGASRSGSSRPLRPQRHPLYLLYGAHKKNQLSIVFVFFIKIKGNALKMQVLTFAKFFCNKCTKKCIFMDKSELEISRLFLLRRSCFPSPSASVRVHAPFYP